VYRTDRIAEAQTNGIATYAARVDLPDTTGARLRSGTWLNEATNRYPATVLDVPTADRWDRYGQAPSDCLRKCSACRSTGC
jgi:putative ABC transport system permease protein